MHKLLFLLPDLQYSGTAQTARLLSLGLRGQGFQPRVCSLAGLGPVEQQLSADGITCSALGWQRWFDAAALLRLRQLLHEYQPETIQVWGVECLGAAVLATRMCGQGVPPRIVCSPILPGKRAGALSRRLHSWLLGRADAVVAEHAQERERYLRLGVNPARIVHSAPGVTLDAPTTVSDPASRVEGERSVLCIGPVEPHKGFRTAIWAFDMLRYLHRDLRLVLVGEGQDLARVRQFAGSISIEAFVHFVGPQENVSGWLRAADVVWVPSLSTGGTQVALEAMAAGRPVVASRVPDLAAVVADGICGSLVPADDPVSLARQTRFLLEDEAQRQRQGEAGRERVRRHFSAEHLVQQFAGLYNARAA